MRRYPAALALTALAQFWLLPCAHAQTVCPSTSASTGPLPTPALTLQLVGAPIQVLGPSSQTAGLPLNGFEGGTWLQAGGVYHLFTTELLGNPKEVNTDLAHWTSTDQVHWQRAATLFHSTGTQTGDDPRAALWAPMPVFDERAGLWNLFYVGYYSSTETASSWRVNYDGYIERAVSTVSGEDGLNAPFRDAGNVLRPSADSGAWEGLQGVDSFFPYRVGDHWMAFYGSAHTERRPVSAWQVGLAAATTLAGPWHRCNAMNPLGIETHFIENPVVLRAQGFLLALFDIDHDSPGAIGYATSRDGVHWSHAGELPLGLAANATLRTPLGLLPNEDGTYSLLVTGRELRQPKTKTPDGWDRHFGSIYFARVRVIPSAK